MFFISELIGKGLLVLVGLSLVIFMFVTGSPMGRLIPSEGVSILYTFNKDVWELYSDKDWSQVSNFAKEVPE